MKELYRQSFGYVYLARHKETGQSVVIKLLERGPSVTSHVQAELLIHRWVICYQVPLNVCQGIARPIRTAVILLSSTREHCSQFCSIECDDTRA